MKRAIFLKIIICLLGAFFPFFVLAAEKINGFESIIKINQDASIDISERIKYDFGVNQKHGIFRTIPIEYKVRGGNYNLRISDIKVTDEKGESYNFQKSFSGKNVEIKIGDNARLVTGEKTYIINYKIKRAINYFENYDELYWNVNGNDWPVKIENVSALVVLPEKIDSGDSKLNCFAGNYGSSAGCSKKEIINGDNIYFSQGKLSAGEGMTIAVGFPKNLVSEPGQMELFLGILKDNWILFLPFMTLAVLFYLWHTSGRDPKGRGTIIAQFEAPDELTPAEIGTIIDEKVHNKDITAEIINLATGGYLKITRIEKDNLFFKSTDYLLEKLKEESGLKNEYEKILLKSLFKNKNTRNSIEDIKKTLEKIKKAGMENFISKTLANILEAVINVSGEREQVNGKEDNNKIVKLSSLSNSFYKDLEKVKKELYETVVEKGYFNKNPKKIRNIYMAIGVIVFFMSWLAAIFFGGWGILSFSVSGLLMIIFGLFMPVKTKKGTLAKEHILGFKKYLSVAEKDRIAFHNAPVSAEATAGKPEKNPKHFEKLLPYAMALRVEEAWAKQFEGIYNQQPDWYNGPSATRFDAPALTRSLGDFSSSAKSTLTSKPSSASGGGSGFSGGGSGGGFGGGGGGSW